MYAIFLKNETGDMVSKAFANSLIIAFEIISGWRENFEPGYSITIKNLSGLSDEAPQ